MVLTRMKALRLTSLATMMVPVAIVQDRTRVRRPRPKRLVGLARICGSWPSGEPFEWFGL